MLAAGAYRQLTENGRRRHFITCAYNLGRDSRRLQPCFIDAWAIRAGHAYQRGRVFSRPLMAQSPLMRLIPIGGIVSI